MNGTSVAFSRSAWTATAVAAIFRSFTAAWSNEKWNVLDTGKLASHGRGQIVCGQFGWSFPFTEHNSARGWSYVINRRGRTSCRLHRGLQDNEGVRVRRTGTATASSVLKVKTQRQKVALEFTHTHGGMCMERPLMTCIGDDSIQIWRTHHLIEPIFPLSPEWTKFW